MGPPASGEGACWRGRGTGGAASAGSPGQRRRYWCWILAVSGLSSPFSCSFVEICEGLSDESKSKR